MRKQTMGVELDGHDDVVTVVVDGRDIRKWEADKGLSFITEDLTYTMLTELAYFGAARAGQFDGDLARWLDEVVSVTQVAEGSARPTRKGRTGGRSSP